MRFLILLSFFSILATGIQFELDTDCSFELPSGKCVQCKHSLFQKFPLWSCQDSRIESYLPKAVTIQNVSAFNVSGTIILVLQIELDIVNMETLDLKILWYKHIGNGYYGLAQHRSTLEFLNLGDDVWNEGSQTRVTIYVTFYGIDLYAKYDIQGVSHPNCYGSGISGWKSFEYSNLTQIKTISGPNLLRYTKHGFTSIQNRTCTKGTNNEIQGLISTSENDKKAINIFIPISVVIVFVVVVILLGFGVWIIRQKLKAPRTIMKDDDGAVMKTVTMWQIFTVPMLQIFRTDTIDDTAPETFV